jgi:hypothetical protein
MNSAAFGVFAAILVLSAVAATFSGSVRSSVLGTGTCVVAAIALFAVQSSFLLALAALFIFAVLAVVVRREVFSSRAHLINAELRSNWFRFAAIPVIAAAAAIVVIAVASGWHQGVSTASLLTIFHYRYPVIGLVAVAAIVAAAVATRVNINVQADEKTHHQIRADKASQAERMARRRADREAARQRRRERRVSE